MLSLSACGQVDEIAKPLEGLIGDAQRGVSVFESREGGHCLLCHMVDTSRAEFQGSLGPDLSTVGSRFTAAQLRLRIVDYDRVKPGTTMPSYFRTENLTQVGPEYAGRTMLSAQDIEDIIAYLETLKET